MSPRVLSARTGTTPCCDSQMWAGGSWGCKLLGDPSLAKVQIETETFKFNKQLGKVLRPWCQEHGSCVSQQGLKARARSAKSLKTLGMRSVTLAGGLSKLEQFKEVKRLDLGDSLP